MAQFVEDGLERGKVMFSRFADMRYLGQEHTVKVPVPNGIWNEDLIGEVIERFHQIHEHYFTFKLDGAPTEIVNLHLTGFGVVQKPEIGKIQQNGAVESAVKEIRPVLYEDTGWIDTKVYDRQRLAPRVSIEGPAIVEVTSVPSRFL